MIKKFTGGDMSLLPKLMEVETLIESSENESFPVADRQKQVQASNFIGLSLEAYFRKLGINPFGV